MAIFQADSPASRGQELFNRIAVAGALAGCCALGLREGYTGAQMVGDAAGRSQIAALLAAMAIGLGGLLLGIYWRTRALGFSLVVCGVLSYGVFLGARAYCARHGAVAAGPAARLGSFATDQKFSLVIYPSCAENPAVQGGDVERGERSSPKLNSVSAAARCTGG